MGNIDINRDTYEMVSIHATLGLAASTTYYWGNQIGLAPQEDSDQWMPLVVPVAGVIIGVHGMILNLSAVGTNEASTLSLRHANTEDIEIDTAMNMNAAQFVGVDVSKTGLSHTVAADDHLEFKWVTPAWATVPSFFTSHLTITIRVPS